MGTGFAELVDVAELDPVATALEEAADATVVEALVAVLEAVGLVAVGLTEVDSVDAAADGVMVDCAERALAGRC